jgi:cytochrome b involved in lipid metabolism
MKFVLLMIGLVILAGCAQNTDAPQSPAAQDAQEPSSESAEPAEQTAEAEPSEPLPMPPFPPADAQGRPLYTMADVEARNSEADCWTAIRGEVYDLTEWIRQHPGGARGILSLCGTDGTQAFEGQHGGRDGPESTLDGYVIGSLA